MSMTVAGHILHPTTGENLAWFKKPAKIGETMKVFSSLKENKEIGYVNTGVLYDLQGNRISGLGLQGELLDKTAGDRLAALAR